MLKWFQRSSQETSVGVLGFNEPDKPEQAKYALHRGSEILAHVGIAECSALQSGLRQSTERC